uniref:Uncharacterized protein n=1 Tax=Oryza nivara TaxID=4536 RepID=A0A0E0IMY0_ORYNI
MIREAIDHYGFVALAMRVKFAELDRLPNMTVFPLDDQAIFVGEGHDDYVSARGPLPRRSRAPPHPRRHPAGRWEHRAVRAPPPLPPRLLLICGIWRGSFGGATRAPLVVQGRHGLPDIPPLLDTRHGRGEAEAAEAQHALLHLDAALRPRRRQGVEGPRRRRWRGLRRGSDPATAMLAAQDSPHLAPLPAGQVCHNPQLAIVDPRPARRRTFLGVHPRRLCHPRAYYDGGWVFIAFGHTPTPWLDYALLNGEPNLGMALVAATLSSPPSTTLHPCPLLSYPPKTSAIRVSYNADDFPATEFNVAVGKWLSAVKFLPEQVPSNYSPPAWLLPRYILRGLFQR